MSRIALVGLLLVGICWPAKAADPVKLPKELAIVPGDVLAFASLNVVDAGTHPALKVLRDSFLKPPTGESFTAATGLKLDDIVRATLVLPVPTTANGPLRVFEQEPIYLLTTKQKLDPSAILKAGGYYSIDEAREIVRRNRDLEEKLPLPGGKFGASHYVNRAETTMAFVDDRTLALTVNRRVGWLKQLPFSPLDSLKAKGDTKPLADGIALAVRKPLAFALNLSLFRRQSEAGPNPNGIPQLFKADSAIGFATLGKDAADFTLTVAFADSQSADAANEEIAKHLKSAEAQLARSVNWTKKGEGDDSPMAKLQSLFVEMARGVTATRVGNEVAIKAKYDLGEETKKLFATIPETVSESAVRTKGRQQLMWIGMAVHNYHDTKYAIPANSYDKNGKALLSWRVHILPLLEQGQLYSQFKLDEPWDSEANKKLIEKMPDFYKLPVANVKGVGLTHYRSFIGAKGVRINAAMIEGGRRRTIASISDGMMNSIFCVEATEPCIWTRPDDISFDPKGKPPAFIDHYIKDRFQVLMFDGTVKSLSTKIKDETLKAYITVNGGETIDE